nr:TetR/AcrR family transcriptional regulator [Paenibacillus arenosi]
MSIDHKVIIRTSESELGGIEVSVDVIADKKCNIIKTAMKLFAHKGYRNTTMQEIAETCQIAKGSLYSHFKSKEDLLYSIFQTFSQSHMNMLCKSDREPYNSEKERFIHQLELHMNYSVEYREIIIFQFKESSDVINDDLVAYLKGFRAEFLSWIEKRLIQIYGPDFEPYAFDTTFTLCGMIHIFTNYLLFEKSTLDISHISRYLIRHLDYMAEKLMQEQPEPLGIKLLLEEFKVTCPVEEAVHPLHITKRMADTIADSQADEDLKVEAKQSLALIEKELTEIQPRRFLIKGMLHNLRSIPQLDIHICQLSSKLKL